MAPIMENWAIVKGTVTSITDHPSMAGYAQIGLDLKDTKDFEDFPNMARADIGQTVQINIKREQLGKSGAKEGSEFEGRVRKAFGNVYFLEELG
jgi:hypothetical protein